MNVAQLNRQLARENRRYPEGRLVEIPPEEWPPPIGRPPIRVLRCRRFLAQVYEEAGYGDRDAFEAYPRQADVVNVANMRHLWVLPEGELLAGIWRPTAQTSTGRPESAQSAVPGARTATST